MCPRSASGFIHEGPAAFHGCRLFLYAHFEQPAILVPPRDGVFLLLRPFALGFCLQSLRDKRDKLEEEAYRRDKSRAYLVDDAAWDEKVQEMGFIGPEDAITLAGMYAERTASNTKRWFVKKIYQALELVYNAASLVIDTLRTFILIVLSILGPIVFGIAVWDGLGGSLSAWFARYISVYLWLPVSSILTALLTKIQVLMISEDIAELQNPGTSLTPATGTTSSSSLLVSWVSSACRRSRAGSSRLAAALATTVAMSIRRRSVVCKAHIPAAR